MKHTKTIGVLAFHGDVIEHIGVTRNAAKSLGLSVEVIEVRTLPDLGGLDGLIIPGGESTTLHKLCERENMLEDLKKIPNIFGTCAGAILLAKVIYHKTPEQKTLELMDMEVDRNAYGRQTESFEKNVKTVLGNIKAVFIRAPKIIRVEKNINIIAKDAGEIIACGQKSENSYYLATTFHPELSSDMFHKYFLQTIFHQGSFKTFPG